MQNSYVERAAGWADCLARQESRCPGDYDNAMRRVAQRIGVGYSTLRGLRYRQPKRIFVDIYFSLSAAYEEMCAAQLKALEAQINERKEAGSTSRAVASAEVVVRALGGGDPS